MSEEELMLGVDPLDGENALEDEPLEDVVTIDEGGVVENVEHVEGDGRLFEPTGDDRAENVLLALKRDAVAARDKADKAAEKEVELKGAAGRAERVLADFIALRKDEPLPEVEAVLGTPEHADADAQPVVEGGEADEGMSQVEVESGPNDDIAPMFAGELVPDGEPIMAEDPPAPKKRGKK